jgi:hypothetical protein
VATAETAKEQIDADIQPAGVKPIALATEVQAEAHQETYPSWSRRLSACGTGSASVRATSE